jgi:hypothetical protein
MEILIEHKEKKHSKFVENILGTGPMKTRFGIEKIGYELIGD